MNVYPRKPLEAEYRDDPVPGFDVFLLDAWERYDDAEFAEHFYPAERLDALLAACEALAETIVQSSASLAVVNAFRAFREQVPA